MIVFVKQKANVIAIVSNENINLIEGEISYEKNDYF